MLLFSMFLADMFAAETDSIELLSHRFKARTDIGSESFEGNTMAMITVLMSMLLGRIAVGPELIVEPLIRVDVGGGAAESAKISDGGAAATSVEDGGGAVADGGTNAGSAAVEASPQPKKQMV